MLACEGSGRDLAFVDNYVGGKITNPHQDLRPLTPERTWWHALVTLAADGRIDRQRLLDETLTACLRDWKPVDSAWYGNLHDALAPTLNESAAREATYRRLLAAGPGPVVALAQRQLTRLLEAGRLDLRALVETSTPVLTRPDKGRVLAQLTLLKAAAKAGATRPAVASAVAQALAHPRTDVQERTLRLLTELVPDPEERSAIVARHADGLAPSMRAARDDVPRVAITSRQEACPRPAPGPAAVEPVGGPAELADLLAALIEDADDPVEVERALDGAARFARIRPGSGAEALARRAETRATTLPPGPFQGGEVRADLAVLTLTWLSGHPPAGAPGNRMVGYEFKRKPPEVTKPDWTMTSLVSLRIHEVALFVAAGGGLLLGAPTHSDGSVGPDAIRDRLAVIGCAARPLARDTGAAALRLDPARHGDLDLPLARRRPAWEPVTGPSEGWFASETYPNATTWRDAASGPGDVDDVVAAVVDRRNPLPLLGCEALDGEYVDRFEAVAALWPLLLPHDPELLAAHAHPRFNRALTKNRASVGPLLDALARSRQPTGPVSCSALVLGLSAKNADDRARAVDAFADLAASGLLDGGELGGQAQRLLIADVIKGNRLAAALTDADGATPSAAGPVLDALEVLLPSLPGRRDAYQFVDLTAQVAVRTGRAVKLPAEFDALRTGRSSSALTAACRRVPTSGL